MPLPPDGCEVRVTDCPESIVGLAGVIAPAATAVFTVTKSATEGEVVAGEFALSVTVAQ